MDMARYFVTAEGLRAAFLHDRVLKDITAILEGRARGPLVEDYRTKGLIDEDRRPPRQVDHNALIVSGAVTRIRDLLGANGGPPQLVPEPPQEGDDLRTRPRRLYRPAPAAERLTALNQRALPGGARRVLRALVRSKVATTRVLCDATGLSRRTVENALGRLRREGLIHTEELP